MRFPLENWDSVLSLALNQLIIDTDAQPMTYTQSHVVSLSRNQTAAARRPSMTLFVQQSVNSDNNVLLYYFGSFHRTYIMLHMNIFAV